MSSPEKIDKAIECIDKAEAVFYKRFPTFMGSLAGSPLFAEIVRYFLEEEAETKQLLKD
jgi:uncharacterized membrane protein YbaN (DUF454 family)